MESSPMMMKGRAGVITALVLIAAPAALATFEAISYFVANRPSGSFMSSGEKRDYVLYVPATYDARKATPLVISLHGGALWGAAQRETSQWDRVADRQGFIVVYPSALSGRGPRKWREEESIGRPREVRFISELIDTLEARYHIDSSRIYANGLSNGGGMSFVLSCVMADRIAAVGFVGAAHFLPREWCAGGRPVPMIDFHGTADWAVPYRGGRSWVAPVTFPDQLKWVASWAKKNGCAPTPMDSSVASDVKRRAYSHCADDADVLLYTIDGGGHTWPGGKALPEWFVGKTTTSIDASAQMWEFFKRHPRPPTGRGD
jgi:polyhydroxybutyrate depolymerase